MGWLKLFKFTAIGLGSLFVLVLVLSTTLAVLGALVGLGLAVFSLVFVTVFITGILAASIAMVYGAYLLLSKSTNNGAEPASIPVDDQEREDPVERLKRRYAADELSETELERQLERELERGSDPIDRELARERER